MKDSSKIFPMDLEFFDNTISEAASFFLPTSGCFLDTAQSGMEGGPMMWHHLPAQSPSATGALPLLPWTVMLSWLTQEEKRVVIAVVVSQDAWALPTARVGCMELLALPGCGGSRSRAALLRLPLVLVLSLHCSVSPNSPVLGSPGWKKSLQSLAFSLNKTQRHYRAAPRPPLC